jgi:hypothetical protein
MDVGARGDPDLFHALAAYPAPALEKRDQG